MSANNIDTEFNTKLNRLGALYEENKDCLHMLSILEEERKYYDQLFEINRELRDIAAIALKELQKQKEINVELVEVLENLLKGRRKGDKERFYWLEVDIEDDIAAEDIIKKSKQ